MKIEPQTPLHLGKVDLVNKTDWVLKRVKEQHVLHAGPTDYPMTQSKAASGELLHLTLQGRCKGLVGVDLATEAISYLKNQYGIEDILSGNIEELSEIFPENTFDVVLAGDVVEHINNVGRFYESAHKVLKPRGRLLLTVPSAFSIKRMLGAVFLRQERNHPDHMYYFSLMNIQQAAWRFGFAIEDVSTFIYESQGDRTNQRANRVVRCIVKMTGNNFLADELAVSMVKIER